MKPRGLLLDLDGTVFVGDALLPGAADAIAELDEAGIPMLFATNMTRRPRRILLEKLTRMGLTLPAERVYTAPIAAASWLASRGIRRILACVARDTCEDLAGFDLVDPRLPMDPGVSCQAVLVGDLGDEWSYAILNAAFRQLMGGAELVAVQRNLYWRAADGLSLDAGPFILGLEAAARVQATLVGKPSPTYFERAAELIGLTVPEIAMVGDDIQSDVLGAQQAGATGILVRTGKFHPEDVARSEPPNHILDSVADLPAWFREFGDAVTRGIGSPPDAPSR
ncbi:MAG: HAD-IIA family hydrolase [Candidatus Eisenbacteria bacterium]|nr:HAD-IIA family hydrolase [Candidatus Eisenbacteria bacterium]